MGEVLSFWDWLIVGLYLAFALGVGVYFSKRASANTQEYFISGRTLPWWLVGTSMVATTFTSDTPLAVTEMVRGYGLWRNWFWWRGIDPSLFQPARSVLNSRFVISWFAGILFIFGATLGLGYFIFQSYVMGLGCMLLSILGGVVIWINIKRMRICDG